MGNELIDVLLSGITNGAVYAIMAMGLALVYGVTKIFNFAYGSFFTLGGYMAWGVFAVGFGYITVFLIAIPAMFAVGWLTESLVVRPLRKWEDWEMTAVMVTLGLALFMDNLTQAIFGPFKKTIPLLIEGQVKWGEFVMANQDIAILFLAVFIMISVIFFLDKHRIGIAMKAVAQNITGASINGVPTNRIFSLTFAISAALVGLASILLAPKYFIHPFGGWTILVKAWVITAFGGMGSIKGSLYAAFILGIVEALVGWHFGFTWTMFAWVAILISTLIIRPQGLLGTWG